MTENFPPHPHTPTPPHSSADPSLRIGVLGPHQCSEEDYELGMAVGAEIAKRGAVLVCGGLDGMMEAAAKGAKSRDGVTIGILPGKSTGDANAFIDVPVPTGLGVMRNAFLVQQCDAVIAVRGHYGTLTEIAFALRTEIPVVGFHTWELVRDGKVDPGIHVAGTAQEAVELAVTLSKKS